MVRPKSITCEDSPGSALAFLPWDSGDEGKQCKRETPAFCAVSYKLSSSELIASFLATLVECGGHLLLVLRALFDRLTK